MSQNSSRETSDMDIDFIQPNEQETIEFMNQEDTCILFGFMQEFYLKDMTTREQETDKISLTEFLINEYDDSQSSNQNYQDDIESFYSDSPYLSRNKYPPTLYRSNAFIKESDDEGFIDHYYDTCYSIICDSTSDSQQSIHTEEMDEQDSIIYHCNTKSNKLYA